MQFLFKNQNNNYNHVRCCICLEELNKNIKYISCKICINTIVCETCNLIMLENGQLSNCPVCRTENWFDTPITPKKVKTKCI